MLTQKDPCTTIKGMRVPKPFSIGSTPASDEGGRFLVSCLLSNNVLYVDIFIKDVFNLIQKNTLPI